MIPAKMQARHQPQTIKRPRWPTKLAAANTPRAFYEIFDYPWPFVDTFEARRHRKYPAPPILSGVKEGPWH
jgi:hypothetical protein